MLTPTPGIAALTLQPGEVVAGSYRIVRELAPSGASAPSATYAALDLTAAGIGGAGGKDHAAVHRMVTLRILPDLASTGAADALGEDDRRRLEQLAAHLARLDHPSVAQTYALSLQPELGVVLAREPVEPEGQPLRDVLAVRGGPLPEAEAIQLCAQIGEALEAAHQQGACHLGLSPACIYVFPDGDSVRIKVADFGLLPPAWAARVGEPGYLAPEQVDFGRGAQVDGKLDGDSCDRRTDQFALAVILYEMLAGQPAFIGAAEEDRQVILARVRNEDPLPLSQSRAVEQALARALSRSRAVRFPSVRDFIRALGADVSGWAVGGGAGALTGPPPRPRRPRLLLPMAAGAIFSLVGLGGFFALRQLTRPKLPPARGPTGPLPAALPDLALPPTLVVAAARTSPESAGTGTDGGAVLAAEAGRAARGEPGARPSPRGDLPLRGATAMPVRPEGTSAPPAGVLLPLSFGGVDVDQLTPEQRAELTSCVRMISPRPPYRIVLQNIAGVLYVDSNHTSEHVSSSQDFRDCLKLRVRGKITPKVLTMTRMIKG